MKYLKLQSLWLVNQLEDRFEFDVIAIEFHLFLRGECQRRITSRRNFWNEKKMESD